LDERPEFKSAAFRSEGGSLAGGLHFENPLDQNLDSVEVPLYHFKEVAGFGERLWVEALLEFVNNEGDGIERSP
jgi:hypothetical protein